MKNCITIFIIVQLITFPLLGNREFNTIKKKKPSLERILNRIEKAKFQNNQILIMKNYKMIYSFYFNQVNQKDLILDMLRLSQQLKEYALFQDLVHRFFDKHIYSDATVEVLDLIYLSIHDLYQERQKRFLKFYFNNKIIHLGDLLNEHNPYDSKTLDALFLKYKIKREYKLWEECVEVLEIILEKSPNSPIADKVELELGQVYLSMNKGGQYSIDELNSAKRHLERSLTKKPKLELNNTIKQRIANRYMFIAEFYMSRKNHIASKLYLDKILSSKEYSFVHNKANQLLKKLTELKT